MLRIRVNNSGKMGTIIRKEKEARSDFDLKVPPVVYSRTEKLALAAGMQKKKLQLARTMVAVASATIETSMS